MLAPETQVAPDPRGVPMTSRLRAAVAAAFAMFALAFAAAPVSAADSPAHPDCIRPCHF